MWHLTWCYITSCYVTYNSMWHYIMWHCVTLHEFTWSGLRRCDWKTDMFVKITIVQTLQCKKDYILAHDCNYHKKRKRNDILLHYRLFEHTSSVFWINLWTYCLEFFKMCFEVCFKKKVSDIEVHECHRVHFVITKAYMTSNICTFGRHKHVTSK